MDDWLSREWADNHETFSSQIFGILRRPHPVKVGTPGTDGNVDVISAEELNVIKQLGPVNHPHRSC